MARPCAVSGGPRFGRKVHLAPVALSLASVETFYELAQQVPELSGIFLPGDQFEKFLDELFGINVHGLAPGEHPLRCGVRSSIAYGISRKQGGNIPQRAARQLPG
jgi:hypothetical protein